MLFIILTIVSVFISKSNKMLHRNNKLYSDVAKYNRESKYNISKRHAQ